MTTRLQGGDADIDPQGDGAGAAHGQNDFITVVVGAGQMGTGIAHASLMAGFPTTLVDVDSGILARAAKAIEDIVSDGVTRGKISREKAAACLPALRLELDVGEASVGANLLIETATESLSLKKSIIEKAEATLPDTAIIATNTSALSISEIAAGTKFPQRLVGMHFFNPVHKMKLVELVRGIDTSDEAIARSRDFAEGIGKQTIVVNETPGLTTSRMSAMLGNEAMFMLLEGTASAEDIDTALRLGLNHPMGPLELGDLTGWDTRLSVLRYLHQTLGEKYRPCPLIVKMVAAGRYGRKVGRGVYIYENQIKVAGSGLRPGIL